jgi:hypothetical protein
LRPLSTAAQRGGHATRPVTRCQRDPALKKKEIIQNQEKKKKLSKTKSNNSYKKISEKAKK